METTASAWTRFVLAAPLQNAGAGTETKPLSFVVLDTTAAPRFIAANWDRSLFEKGFQPSLRWELWYSLGRRNVALKQSLSRTLYSEAKAQEVVCTAWSELISHWNTFTGTVLSDKRRMYWGTPGIVAEHSTSQCIFDAVQALYLSQNRPRDRQIAERLTTLYRAAIDEDETVRPASISQLQTFFLEHPDLGMPKITLTPDGTLRARWIQGKESFVAIEFTGEPSAKLVAEIPRGQGLTAAHFGTEPLKDIVAVAQAMGASFAST